MTQYRWLTLQMVDAFHAESIARFGGSDGVRDLGLLESALARPLDPIAYGQLDVFALAAVYCSGIIQNHPFVDGNKRTGLLAARVFLSLNGYAFNPNETDTVATITDLAAGVLDDEASTRWLSDFSTRKAGGQN